MIAGEDDDGILGHILRQGIEDLPDPLIHDLERLV